MATTKFNNIIMESARRLKDSRSDASPNSDTGKRYSSAILARYANKAVRDFLIDKYLQLGKEFPDLFPEYVVTSGALTLVSNVVAKPTDAMTVLDLEKSDYSLRFDKLKQSEVQIVRSGSSGLIVPSATHPVFWEEALNIVTLPAAVAAFQVIARYIKTHQDIAVSVASVGAGKHNTAAAGSYDPADRKLTVAMNVSWAASDVNKKLMFWDSAASKVYFAQVESFVSASQVVIKGDGLPTAIIASSDITEVLVSDRDPDGTDLQLNEYWHGEIVDRVVEMGIGDANKGLV